MEKIKIGVIFGGKSSEHKISLVSAYNILKALKREAKYEIYAIGITPQGLWLYIKDWESFFKKKEGTYEQELKEEIGTPLAFYPRKNNPICLEGEGSHPLKIDIVFPVLHGQWGEDGSIQGLFQILNIPFVGSDVLGSAVGMDKEVCKRLVEKEIPVAPYFCFHKHQKQEISFFSIKEKIGLPFFIKPARQGSSIGVHRIQEEKEFREKLEDTFSYDQKILIEKNIEGRELECAVLGNETLISSKIGEILMKKDFYSYEAKYLNGSDIRLLVPTELSKEQEFLCQEISKKAYKLLSLQGLARIDMFLDKNSKIWLNEVNTMPGFTSISMYPNLWEKSGLPLGKLLERLISLGFSKSLSKASN